MEEFRLLTKLRVMVTLGQIAFRETLKMLEAAGEGRFRPRPKFGHGKQIQVRDDLWILTSYHPSQQNTFTGVLTETMFDDVFRLAKQLLK